MFILTAGKVAKYLQVPSSTIAYNKVLLKLSKKKTNVIDFNLINPSTPYHQLMQRIPLCGSVLF